MDNWESLRSECLACKRCGLWETRKHVVFGVGPQDAEVLFIGEGPGEQEDLKGEPFVGRGGKHRPRQDEDIYRQHGEVPPAEEP